MIASRRNLLQTAAASLAVSALPLRAAAITTTRFFGKGRTPLGLQLYTLDAEVQKDFEGTLRRVARMGVEIVELAGTHGRSAKEVRRSLEAAGLRATGMHVPAAPIPAQPARLTFADVQQVIDYAQELGVANVVLPIIQFPAGDRWGEAIDLVQVSQRGGSAIPALSYERLAGFLNETGTRLQQSGLRLGYHNHNVEFSPIGKTNGMEILLARCDPALVTFELDAGWVAAAGLDPVTLLERHRGRFTQMHVKDVKASPTPNYAFRQQPAEVGSGMLDWPRVLHAAFAGGVRYFYVEQEPPFAVSALESVGKSCAYLKTLGLQEEGRRRGGGGGREVHPLVSPRAQP